MIDFDAMDRAPKLLRRIADQIGADEPISESERTLVESMLSAYASFVLITGAGLGAGIPMRPADRRRVERMLRNLADTVQQIVDEEEEWRE